MKRFVIVLVLILFMFLSVPFRMIYLVMNTEALPNVAGSERNVVLSDLRGEIFDVNGEKLVNRQEKYKVVAKPCIESAETLEEYLSKEEYNELLECIKKSVPFVTECEFDKENEYVKRAKVFERYPSDGFCCHVLGYVNTADNKGVAGVEKSYNDILIEGKKSLLYTYSTSGYGKTLAGGESKIKSLNYYSQKGIKLTIDSQIQRIAENAMRLYEVERGAVVVLDSESGEIRAMASFPNFNQNDVASSLNASDSPFLNRAVSSFSVGSVFKLVVAAAAVKEGKDLFQSYCDGSVELSEKIFSCSNSTAHGQMTLSRALSFSCNTYFIRLALEIGSEKLLKTAEDLGFGKAFKIAENFYCSSGNLPTGDEIATDGMLANFSFGQGGLLASPLQLASCYSAAVNGGSFVSPRLVLSLVNHDGTEITAGKNQYKYRVFSKTEAEKLKKMLENNFNEGTCVNAKPENVKAGGKTSTAETGWLDADGNQVLHSWFVGFAETRENIYTIAVFKEDGVSGSSDCGPVFKEIAERLAIIQN